MAKSKHTLSEIKVNSFVTTLDEQEMNQLKGGIYIIRGRRFSYRTRWTSVDTRSEEAESSIWQRMGSKPA
ncbi:MAG: hypothetical protein H6574_14695 [Lewinellaceae bacterium]|nr:pinensin family lanthipeptide [Saprospiraceae bacterium]MCB9332327.1 hypothetical protein [Lewinellaceae bacterium]